MDNILIGKVLKPQGIKGEVKVKAFTADLDQFLLYGKFIIDGKEFKIIKGRHDNSFAYIQFEGYKTMNDAETLRDKELYIKRSSLRELEEDEYYLAELENSSLYVDGKEVGVVKKVDDSTRNIVLYVNVYGKAACFPLAKKAIESFDRKKGILNLNEKGLKEVILFED
ncbi:MAG: 16S rRNA processing protein RimM [Clostridia bacterium]|nr:16S rRNA processing protein RimM [Clostridia bacterium]